jgi:ABC-2 type transport system permease protein
MNLARLRAVASKEIIQIRRDRRSLVLAFLLPMALILFFGYAISFDVDDIPLGVFDQDRSSTSRQLVESFQSSGYFRIVRHFSNYQQLEAAMDRGDVLAVVVIDADYSKHRQHPSRPAVVQLILDGGDANTATIARGYATALVRRASVELRASTRLTNPVAEVRVWYNETLESVNMIVPGLIAVIMSIIAAMLTALTIAREWERGTMEQLAATPVSRAEVVLGKLIPYVGIGMIDVTLAVLAGTIVFDVPLRGNLMVLAILSLLFLLGALGLGMFISAVLKSQVLATQVAMIATYLPALLLSGFLYAIANMPTALQAFTYIIPARYYITVTRGIFLKGVGVNVLWGQALAMSLFAVIGISLATLAFRKEIAR